MTTSPPPTPTPLAAVVTLLDRAERECAARGESATSILDDLAIWHLDAQLVRIGRRDPPRSDQDPAAAAALRRARRPALTRSSC
jgi:hypothetical protein